MPPLPEMKPVTSSIISHVGHDGALIGTLYLRFKPRDDAKLAGLWSYHGVPRVLHDAMLETDSLGKFFHARIKPAFRAEKVAT